MDRSRLLARSWSVRTRTIDSEARQEAFSSKKLSAKSDARSEQHTLRRSRSAPRVLYRTRCRKQLQESNGPDAKQLPGGAHRAMSTCQGSSVESAGILSQGFSSDVIGLALGSPKKDLPSLRPEANELRGRTEPPLSHDFSSGSPQACCREDAPNLKTKTSRWKKLGVFFGKKDAPVPDPLFASLYPTSIARQDMRKHEVRTRRQPFYHTDAPYDRKLSNSTSHTEQKNRPKAPRTRMKRSQTVPFAPRGEMSPKPPPKDACFLSNAPHLLQVNIPKSDMERYSVMFSSLLDSGPGQESSSLLARRQGHLEKLRSASDADREDNHPNDRFKAQQATAQAYSPGAGSASFSLFPSTPPDSGRRLPDKPKPKPKPSPLQRSVTVPNGISDHSAVPTIPINDKSHFTFMFHSPAPSPTTTIISQDRRRDSDLSSSPARTEWCFVDAPEPKSKHAKSFLPCRKDSLLFPKHLENSDFTSSKVSSTTVVRQNKFPADCASAPLPYSGPEVEHPLQHVAEISIARQISVSRQQRQVLVPIVPQTARHPIKPSLVDVCSAESLRRSHHVLLEDV